MEPQNLLTFDGKAGDYFVMVLVTTLVGWIPFFGWAFGMNYMSEWIGNHTTMGGRRLTYSAGFGETLGFVTVNALLLCITFGIYTFWFVPKTYRYFMEHTTYAQ